jgi:hypothetical protein
MVKTTNNTLHNKAESRVCTGTPKPPNICKHISEALTTKGSKKMKDG